MWRQKMIMFQKWLVSRRAPLLGVSVLFLLSTLLLFVSMAEPKKPASERIVVIVGGGMAGLSAAIEASQGGASVVLIEGQKTTGGNSAKATSGINGCDTPAQRALNIKDGHDLFYSDTIRAGHDENDPDLVDVLVHHAADSVKFLNGLLDIPIDEVSVGGGHSVPRTHAFSMPPDGKLRPFGATVMRTVFAKLQEIGQSTNGRFRIMFETRVEDLLTDPQNPLKVIGVRYKSINSAESEELLADAVVLATGGFCNDHSPGNSLLAKYAGDKSKYPTTNGPFADGSGMKMAERLGAKLIDMEKIQIHPTGFIDPNDPKSQTKFLAAEALRGSGAILLNERGERFTNELGLRDFVTNRILDHCALNETTGTHTAYMILNQEAVDKFGRPAFKFYWEIKKFFKKVDNLDELAALIHVEKSVMEKTFKDYNGYKNGLKTDPMGKTVFSVEFKSDETFFIGSITPVLHYTMGGVKINEKAQVINGKNGKVIEGLYAAGEVAGGIHGGNRLSGNSYLDCVVFGRIAGQSAILD